VWGNSGKLSLWHVSLPQSCGCPVSERTSRSCIVPASTRHVIYEGLAVKRSRPVELEGAAVVKPALCIMVMLVENLRSSDVESVSIPRSNVD
jgi:hypothetical protein